MGGVIQKGAIFLRVIAGVARRTVLLAPAGDSTRPTADRAKEGLFNVLSPRIRGARFLDLFCGSGAIGIEALSRGAAQAVFVDNAPSALSALKKNLDKTRLLSSAEIFATDVASAITALANAKRVFDIIFFDPPYNTYLLEETLVKIKNCGLLAPGSVIIAETDAKVCAETNITVDASADKNASENFGILPATDRRIYGRTSFLFFAEDAV